MKSSLNTAIRMSQVDEQQRERFVECAGVQRIRAERGSHASPRSARRCCTAAERSVRRLGLGVEAERHRLRGRGAVPVAQPACHPTTRGTSRSPRRSRCARREKLSPGANASTSIPRDRPSSSTRNRRPG